MNSSAPGDAIARLELPRAIAAALEQVRRQLIDAAGDELTGLVLYGSAARGRFREGHSDINLAIVLRRAPVQTLRALVLPLEFGRRAAAVDPFVLAEGEVAGLVDVFPIKVLEIQRHHVVLFGHNPFKGLAVDHGHVRMRVEQQLRNLLFRLRRAYLGAHDAPAMLQGVLASAARKLAVDLEMLMMLRGQQAASTAETAAQLAAAAAALDLDAQALAQVAGLRHGGDAGDIDDLYGRVLTVVERVVALADGLEARS